jgi:hypothetical protein
MFLLVRFLSRDSAFLALGRPFVIVIYLVACMLQLHRTAQGSVQHDFVFVTRESIGQAR